MGRQREWTIQDFRRDISRIENRLSSGDTREIVNGRDVDVSNNLRCALSMHRAAVADLEESMTIEIVAS